MRRGWIVAGSPSVLSRNAPLLENRNEVGRVHRRRIPKLIVNCAYYRQLVIPQWSLPETLIAKASS
jgi:hypothetical protein